MEIKVAQTSSNQFYPYNKSVEIALQFVFDILIASIVFHMFYIYGTQRVKRNFTRFFINCHFTMYSLPCTIIHMVCFFVI